MIIKKSKSGSIQDFMNAVQNELSEAGVKTSEVIASTDRTFNDRYIHDLIGDAGEYLDKEVDAYSFDSDDESLYLDIRYNGTAPSFRFDFDELEFDFDKIDNDVRYIVNTVCQALDESIEAATNTSGIAAAPEIIEADTYDADMLGEYFTEIADAVKANVDDIVESLIFDVDDNNLYATIGVNNTVQEIKIPFADLSIDTENIDPDVEIISDAIRDAASIDRDDA